MADLRAEQELILHPEKLLMQKQKKKNNHRVKDLGSRESLAKFECFPWRDTLVPALTCAQMHNDEEV